MASTKKSGAKPASDRVRVRRRSPRANYETATVHSILDQALICHLGFTVDDQPYVLPTIHVRIEDTLYLHGQNTNRMFNTAASGAPLCVEATIVDSMVLGRSWFHNSLNYRSVVALGTAREVDDPDEKLRAIETMVRRFVPPERLEHLREIADYELKQTIVIAFPLDECSAKIRSGAIVDEERDLSNPVWSGEFPLQVVVADPVADEYVPASTPLPEYAASWASRLGSTGFTH